jgi:hypothetical protein
LILPDLHKAFDAWGLVRGGRLAAVAGWLARVDAAPHDVRLAAMLVELASPLTDPHVRDLEVGRRVDDVLRALKFSNQESQSAGQLVSVARAVEVTALTAPQLRKLFSQIGREHVAAALALWRAHAPATAAIIAEAERIVREREPLVTKDLAITGKDLMQALAQPPGPTIGRILGLLLDRVLDDPSLNTRDRLLALAQELELQAGQSTP